ncbi:MAG TPA: hypothetical protein VHE34_01725 [Puia sp.]|uniref:hypothetical protein n=1 Tax=Puia sp. TaxID=2045100 RepID=UPI002B75EAC3|nr:hypothetical protein [Puia sp.]HVU93903.1 hypothetical protein [Puia sp.]
MLNLSDKELDRFSQEAAQEYEPGDVLGPRSWERLEVRMTQEFGRPGWNPIRHIRRFPFYYAPALLLLLGVGYYLMRPGVSSGSSPGATSAAGRTVPAKATTSETTTSVQAQKSANTDKATSTPATSSSSSAPQGGGTAPATSAAPGGANAATAVPGGASAASVAPGGAPVDRARGNRAAAGGVAPTGASSAVVGSGGRGMGRRDGKGSDGKGLRAADPKDLSGSDATGANGVSAGAASTVNSGTTTPTRAETELSLAYVQRPRSLAKRPVIGDSALRAFNAKSGAPTLIKRKGIYEINRKWQFGLTLAPDFASVNSLAGDKAGSSIGLTVDYMFAPHWYLNTGILATRRNYAARNQDYHAPQGFYQQYNIYSSSVTIVKGSFYMMEIPLNLRYDFSVAGNTLFFISAGSSSYLMTTENANMYWRHLSRDVCSSLDHLPTHGTNLFSTVNLSAGVETGLSNSFSLLVAPYMKLPTKKLGLGQVDMNSVGIDFTLKWAPITGRRRR